MNSISREKEIGFSTERIRQIFRESWSFFLRYQRSIQQEFLLIYFRCSTQTQVFQMLSAFVENLNVIHQNMSLGYDQEWTFQLCGAGNTSI